MLTLATCSRFPTAAADLSSVAASSRQRRRCSFTCTHPCRKVRAKAKSQRDPESLREPPPQTPLEDAVEETLYDGRHVLVVLDKLGARLYRTQMSSATPSSLEPLIHYNHRVHLDPEGGSGAKSEAMERKARTLPNQSKEVWKKGGGGGGSGGGSGGGGSSGGSGGVGGGYPLTDSVLRGVVSALKDVGPAVETTLLIAAHGKGKSDGAAALVAYLKRHAPELADRVAGRTAPTLVVGDVVHLEGERGGRPLTEAQLLSAARRAYRTILRPRVPLEPRKVGFTHGRRVRHV